MGRIFAGDRRCTRGWMGTDLDGPGRFSVAVQFHTSLLYCRRLFLCVGCIGGGAEGQRGQLPPHSLTDRGQTVSNAPTFRRLGEMMPASTEKHRHRWKCVKYLPKKRKMCFNYFKKFSASGGLPPPDPIPGLRLDLDPSGGRGFAPPSQTSFRRSDDICRYTKKRRRLTLLSTIFGKSVNTSNPVV